MIFINIRNELEGPLSFIQKEELAFLVIDDLIIANGLDVIEERLKRIAERTNRMFLLLDTVHHDQPNYDKFLNCTIPTWIGSLIEVGSDETYSGNRIYSNADGKSIRTYEAIRNMVQNPSRIIPVFSLTKNHYQLGPTVFTIFEEFGLEFAYLNVARKDQNILVAKYREAFEYLRLRGFKKGLHFRFDSAFDKWNAKTFNTFSGLKVTHIDLSNKCTHSCVFCGLWGPEFIENLKKNEGGKLSQGTKDFMNNQIPYDRAMEVISNLPDTVSSVQFGGAGDPLTHPNWLEILRAVRSRGVETEVLSNFEYPTFNQIAELHALSRGKSKFTFYVNISGATPETYIKVRPRQTEETFNRVVSNLAYAYQLRLRDGYGLNFCLVNIINKHNFREVVQMVELAHSLGTNIWLKPLEIHNDVHRNQSIASEDMDEFRHLLKEALKKSKFLEVPMMCEEFVEAIIGADS